jgi:hypothetical protein
MLRYLQLSEHKVNPTKMAIVVLAMWVEVILAVYLPTSAFSQIPFIPDSHDGDNSSNRTIHSSNNNIKISSSEGTNSSSLNKATNTSKPKLSILQVKATEVTANLSQKGVVDKFGIKEMYPTKKGGREWHINMTNPRNDPAIFSIGSKQNIIRQTDDGSWRITNPQVRMRVTTPPSSTQWKNVEITGYVKVNATNITMSHHHQKDIPNDIAWLARGGAHTDNAPCSGTALIGGIYDDGAAGWKKEIWFTGGYTKELAQAKPTDSIVGRWIGWKVVMYNINNDTAVRMESYLDDKNSNHWMRVTNLTDSGGWYADTSDKKFYSANCGKPKDYVVTNSGPMVMFRADNMILDFKNLSVREIEPHNLK